jgi:hypothetical protein
MRNSPLLDNGSVSTFPLQRIDAVTDELFEKVIYIRFASKLVQLSSVKFISDSFVEVQKLSVQLWSVNQRTTEAEEDRFVNQNQVSESRRQKPGDDNKKQIRREDSRRSS